MIISIFGTLLLNLSLIDRLQVIPLVLEDFITFPIDFEVMEYSIKSGKEITQLLFL